MASFVLTGGINAVAPGGTQIKFSVTGSWAAGDSWQIVFTDVSGSITVGTGTIFGTQPADCLTLNNKLYFVSGQTLYFSAVGDPTGFDPQDVGSGYIVISNRTASAEELLAIASYQGRLAVFSRRTAQIWTIDADPAKYSQNQVLANIGPVATRGTRSFGDMDVFFPADSGVRSLRVRDSSLNAFVSDIGSSVDSLIIDSLAAQAASQKPICGVINPMSNRYWVFIEDTIYVFSYFPASKVAAWSTYDPSYELNGVQTAFQPLVFATLGNQIWLRAVDGAVYVYGGPDGTIYDNCLLVVETPWLDVKKPATYKTSLGVDLSAIGSWTLKGSQDYLFRPTLDKPTSFQVVLNENSGPSFDVGIIPWSSRGTHFKFRAECDDASAATLSMLIWHYKENEEKK